MRAGGARFIKVLWQIGIALLVLWAFSDLAGAHSVVIESSPKDKEVLTRAPREVVLCFCAKIEKSFARISLGTNNGRMIPLPAPVEKAGREAPDLLVIPLPNLGPGEYLLRYKVLSTDGHATSGVLRFSVVSGP